MCTGIKFVDGKGNMYFGRNLDWGTPFGQSVFATQRGFKHPKFQNGELEGKYACIGMALSVEDFPLYFDAANEVGLACAGLNFPGYAKYEDAPVEGKVNVPSYAFPLYVVSQFETVDEAEAALKNVAITGELFNKELGVSMLHWIIGDAKRTIVVEYMEDGMHIYDDDLDVLANQPTFPYHHENVRNYISVCPDFPAPVKWNEDTLTAYGSGSGMRGLPGDFYSPSRFVRAAYFNSHYPEQPDEKGNVLRLFRTLQGAAMIIGGAKMDNGDYEYTTYTGGYSQATKSYYSSTYEDPKIRKFEMASVPLDGGKVVSVPESA